MKKILAIAVALMLVMGMTVTAFATGIAFIDGKTPSIAYKVTSDITELNLTVTALVFNETAVAAGNSWNDWCLEIIRVTAPDGTVNYYSFGGGGTSWETDVDGDGVADVSGAGSEDFIREIFGAEIPFDLVVPVAGAGTLVEIIVTSWNADVGNQLDVVLVNADDAEEVPVEVPAAEEAPAEEAPAEDAEEAPAEDTEEAPAEESEPAETGLALAVVPMLLAAAAVVISKKR